MRVYKTYRLKKSPQTGMTLIEVLVALFILSTGILGAVAMQATAKKGSFDAMQRSMASSLTQDIIERMRGNDPTMMDFYTGLSPFGTGKITNPPICNSSENLCNRAQMITNDLYGWEQSLIGAGTKKGTVNAGGLVNAVGCIYQNNNAVTVVIAWQGRTKINDAAKVNNCGSTSNKRRQVVVKAFIY